MDAVIEVRGLRKEYRDLRGRTTVALDDLDIEIGGAGVYGLLGPNGSGKTTTIRCLLGLVRPTAGEVRVLGADVADLHTVVHRVGALVEGPKFAPTTSARRNLSYLAAVSGTPTARIDEVLDLVDLSDRADERVGGFSLGMAQRLGIAAALLSDPQLVILDEPTNGLDPAGIADMRRLVRRLADEGRTVVMSSHQLHEVQQVCDRVVILRDGRTLAAGTLDEILTAAAGRRVVVDVESRDAALAVLIGAGFHALPTVEPDRLIVSLDGPATGADINRILAHEGLFASRLVADAVSLETAFLDLTAGGGNTPASTKDPV